MANPTVDRYAAAHDISNSEAKRRLRRKAKPESGLPKRGTPVAGTGKPKGEKKK